MNKALKNNKIKVSVGAFAVFVIYTILVKIIDVKPIGPEGSKVGFAALNGAFASFKTNIFLYTITDFLGWVAIAVCMLFGVIGALQLINRRSLFKVDADILLLGAFYAVVMFFYAIFEKIIINYRPVIINPSVGLEASYPSSHTMLTLCVMVTAIYQVQRRFKKSPEAGKILTIVFAVIAAVTLFGRLFSGVHWLTDIIGGIILSISLIFLYFGAVEIADGKKKK